MKRMLIFYPDLYLGEGIKEKKLDKIKKKLCERTFPSGAYLITLARSPIDQLEILDARQLVQRYYETHALSVVGIAGDYEDALQLVRRITQECLDKRGDCRLKEYLTC